MPKVTETMHPAMVRAFAGTASADRQRKAQPSRLFLYIVFIVVDSLGALRMVVR